jgi:DNA-binding MarR family transcriptional regulator
MKKQFELHNRIGFKVTRLARIMETRLEAELTKHGITRLMWCLLRGIGMENVTSPSELADYVCVARPAISRLLKSMEDKGLVKRISEGSDKRFTEVALTELGVEKMKVCHKLVQDLNQHFSTKLSQNDYELFMSLIDQLTEGEDMNLMRL